MQLYLYPVDEIFFRTLSTAHRAVEIELNGIKSIAAEQADFVRYNILSSTLKNNFLFLATETGQKSCPDWIPTKNVHFGQELKDRATYCSTHSGW